MRLALVSLALGAVLGVRVAAAQTMQAPAGEAPVVRFPVGPVPGPGPEPVGPKNPYAGDGVAVAEGRRLFVWFNCSGCHGGRGGGGMGPSLRDPDWFYGSSDAHVFASIAEGRGQGMPAWGGKVPDEQIWKMVAYIKSLRTPREPQPPAPYEKKG
jgi:cytochrome c oxidase cbb3-type subunit 3